MDFIQIIKQKISREELQKIAEQRYGDLVKAVVDVNKELVAIGGELHADEEQFLIEQGSRQEDLWGINLYPGESLEKWIEFDSVINLRPSQGNRSRAVDNPEIREKIKQVIQSFVI